MKRLVEADVASQSSKPRPDRQVLAWLPSHARDCYLSGLTVAELACGVEVAPDDRQPALAAWLANLLAGSRTAILPLDEAVLVAWKALLARLKADGSTLACEDSLLAAHASALGFGVATLNRRHFEAAGCHCADFAATG